jgi:DNA polymerase III delta prime subunit
MNIYIKKLIPLNLYLITNIFYMSINKLLLWEKWRPKNMDDIILLPRIKKHFEKEIDGNYIFHGNYGTGKTSLARILIGKYSKDKPNLEINSSLSTSINILRSEIEDFCKFTPMMESESDLKFVFLDEFDRTSSEFQDAFKAFIETYSKRGVRFIITTNHINKVSEGIKSRIPQINFDCLNPEEEKFLKQEIYKKIQSKILPEEKFEISKEHLVKIINKKFPDFRSILVEVSNFINTGEIDSQSQLVNNKVKLELYNLIYEQSLEYMKVYNFIMTNFGPDNIDNLIKLLGKSFIDWSIQENKSIEKLFECNYIIADYSSKLETNTDPIILGMTIIGKLNNVIYNNKI